LRLGSVVNKILTTKNKTRYTYHQINGRVKNKYQENDGEIDLGDMSYDPLRTQIQSLKTQAIY
jgi:hypothetical protein